MHVCNVGVTDVTVATVLYINKYLLSYSISEHSHGDCGSPLNASRGGIVDEEALLDILSSKKIKGAGFDVFASEPLPEDSALRKLDNLVLTPHLGASTGEAQIRVGEMVLNQLREFFLNSNLLNEVKA